MTDSAPSWQTKSGQLAMHEQGIRPRPLADDLTAPYWEAAARHRLELPTCPVCDKLFHPGLVACPRCGGTARTWTAVSGRGTVYSYIIDHRNLVPGFAGEYAVLLMVPEEADDDLRLVANLRGARHGDLRVGMQVEVVFEDIGGGAVLPQCRPVSAPPA